MSSALVSRSAWGHEATSEGSQPCIHSTQRARPTLVVLIIISDANNLKALKKMAVCRNKNMQLSLFSVCLAGIPEYIQSHNFVLQMSHFGWSL